MVLFSAADLLWATRIKSTADALGVPCRPVRNPDMLGARLDDSPVRALLLDLEAPDRAWALLGVLRGPDAGDRERSVTVLAWGPHVAADRLDMALEMGADEVMPRGAFASDLPKILTRFGGV